MSTQLGVAILELDGDLAPLDVKLADAKARVDLAVGQMQAMFDSLHMDLNVGDINAAAAAAERLAAAQPSSVVPAAGGGNGGGNGGGGLWGVRGPDQPGSRTNPVVFVQEAAKYTPLGGLAAAVGESDVADAASGTSSIATAEDVEALRSQMANMTDLAQRITPASRLAAEGRNGIGMPWPTGTSTTASASDLESADALRRAADALAKINGGLTAEEQQRAGLSRGVSSSTSRTSITDTTVYDYGNSGGAAGGGRGGGGEPPVAYGPGAPFPEGGGSRRSDIYYHRASESPGGSRTLRDIFGAKRTIPDTGDSFTLANLLKGDEGRGGMFGLPGFGSIGSLGGLGSEHLLLTGLGLTASAGSAIGGAGLLGAAGLTTAAVGGGADMLINHETLANVKAAVPVYQALTAAVKQYGPASAQAQAAAASWDAEIQKVGPEVADAAKSYAGLVTEFDKDSKGAQQQGAAIMVQALGLGAKYVPLVTAAAQKNLGLINQGLKPLFTWLEGPEGIQIFDTLEDKFSKDLPTSLNALDMGIEDFLRLMQAASQYTGGLSKDLDNFFTGKAQESTAQYDQEVQKLVGDLKEWEALLKILSQDLGGIFTADAGTANSIVGSLTQMLTKLHTWETSTTGQMDLDNIFEVHKKEILQLLQLLPKLLDGYGSFYLDVAPALVSSVTGIAKVFEVLLGVIEKIPGGADLIGGAIVLSKLGLLKTAVKALGIEFGVLAGEEKAAAGGEAALGAGGVLGGGAAAGAGAAGAEEAGAGGAAAGLFSKGILGMIRSSTVGSAVEGAVTDTGAVAASSAAIGGSDALAGIVAGGTAALAPAMAVIAPVAIAALGIYGVDKLINALGSSSKPTTSYSDQGLADLLQKYGTAALHMRSGAPNPEAGATNRATARAFPAAAPTVAGLGSSTTGKKVAQQYVDIMSDKTAVAQMSPQTLQDMINEGQALAKMLAAAGSPSLASTIQKFVSDAQQDLAPLENAMDLITGRWDADAGSGLKTLQGTFSENMKLISSTVGLQSDEGRKLMDQNIQGMVADITAGMSDGKISVSSGMAAIMAALNDGMKNGATSWQTKWGEVFNTLSSLFAAHKIDYQTFSQGIGNAMTQVATKANQEALSMYGQTRASLLEQLGAGQISVHQYGVALKIAQSNILTDQANVIVTWLGNLEQTLQSAGKLTGTELSIIQKEINHLAPSASSAVVVGAQGGNVGAFEKDASATGHAAGGLVQVGRPGEAGRDTVPMSVAGTPFAVAPGEQIAVFSRHQVPIVDGALAMAGFGGLSGLFGSVSTPNYMASGGLIDSLGNIARKDTGKTGQTDWSTIQQAIALINGLIGSGGSGGKVAGLMNGLSFYQSMMGLQDPYFEQPASAYVITADPVTGAAVTPYIDQSAVAASLAEYNLELSKYISPAMTDLNDARKYVVATMPAVKAAIDRRKNEIAAKRAKIEANVKQIALWTRQIAALQKQVATEQTKKKPNKSSIKTWKNQIIGLQGYIRQAEAENARLGGDSTQVGSGGQIGPLQTQVSSLEASYSTMSGYAGSEFNAGSGASAYGNDQISRAQIESYIAGLSPAALQAALNAANNSSSGDLSETEQDTMASIYQAALTAAANQNFVFGAQGAVFGSGPSTATGVPTVADISAGIANLNNSFGAVIAALPPFAGSFAEGGIVPGALGAPAMVLAHGGEVITPAEGGPSHRVHVVVEDGAVDPNKIRVIAQDEVHGVTRKMAKRASRPRAGQRAGMLTRGPRG